MVVINVVEVVVLVFLSCYKVHTIVMVLLVILNINDDDVSDDDASLRT